MKYSIFLIFLFLGTTVLADTEFGHFYMEGKVLDSREQPIKNDYILIEYGAANKLRKVKTDSEGFYRVRLTYTKPCLSGGDISEKSQKRVQLAYKYNGKAMKVYHLPSVSCVELPEHWSRFYFNKNKSDEKKVVRNIYMTGECEQNSQVLSDKTKFYLSFRSELQELLEAEETTKKDFGMQILFGTMLIHIESIGLSENEFFNNMGIPKNSILVDSITEDKIVLSTLSHVRHQDDFLKETCTYYKNKGKIERVTVTSNMVDLE